MLNEHIWHYFSREYTQNDHLTGTHNNNMLRNMLKEQLEGYGLDVRLATYNVLLSYAKWYVCIVYNRGV